MTTINHHDCAPCNSGDHATIEPDEHGVERCTCCGIADISERCPECDAIAVTIAPGSLPVCQACDWTGWEKR
jgi:hypothetical protein